MCQCGSKEISTALPINNLLKKPKLNFFLNLWFPEDLTFVRVPPDFIFCKYSCDISSNVILF